MFSVTVTGVMVCGSQCGFIGIKRLTNHWITLELELVISATLHHPGHSGPRHKLLMARNEMFTQIMVTPPQWETEKGNVLCALLAPHSSAFVVLNSLETMLSNIF